MTGTGRCCTTARPTPAAMENHGDREEVREALASGAGEVTRMSDTIDEKTYYYAVKLTDGQVLRIASTTDTVFAALFSVLPWIVGSALLAVAVTALLSSYLTKRIVAPINQLDLEHPEENLTYDEISPPADEDQQAEPGHRRPDALPEGEAGGVYRHHREHERGLSGAGPPHGHPLLQHQRPAAVGLPRRPGGRPGERP